MISKITYKGREIVDIEVDGFAYWDYPDFCDAYFSHAAYADTLKPLTDDELEELTENNLDLLNALCHERIH